MENKKYYVVFVGRICGIYTSEAEALAQTEDYQDSYCDVYTSLGEAHAAIEQFFIGIPRQSADKPLNRNTSCAHD